jgi:hypothetical protein
MWQTSFVLDGVAVMVRWAGAAAAWAAFLFRVPLRAAIVSRSASRMTWAILGSPESVDTWHGDLE